MTAAASTWPPHVGGRTHQPVRRGSQPFEAGEAFFRPLKKATVVQIMRGAERLAIRSMKTRGRGRVKRRHAGELTLSDLNILQALLFRFLDWRSGRCAPTYQDLADETGHARDTISGAIRRLRKAGILEKMRRFTRLEDVEGKGPQVQQAPNAYRFDLPVVLRALLGLGAESRPIPDDARTAALQARLSNGEQEAEQTGKSNLESVLAAWGRGLDQRESRN